MTFPSLPAQLASLQGNFWSLVRRNQVLRLRDGGPPFGVPRCIGRTKGDANSGLSCNDKRWMGYKIFGLILHALDGYYDRTSAAEDTVLAIY